MNYQNQAIDELIRSVRKRRLLLTIMKGAAVLFGVGTLLLISLGYLAYQNRANGGVLDLLRLTALVVLISVVYLFIIRPLRKRTSDAQIARLVEERHSGLEDRLVSAIEFGGSPDASSPTIVNRLIDDAGRNAADVRVEEIIPGKRAWQFGALALVFLGLGIGSLFFGPRQITGGVAHLLAPTTEAATSSDMRIQVKPGNSRVPKSSDQRIFATLQNFSAEPVTLFVRKHAAKDDQWVGQPMEPSKNTSDYQFFIFNIQDSVDYFVEANGVKSETYKLDVVDLPYVKRIDLNLTFPAFTGMPAKTLEDSGEIATLSGTSVRITARLTGKARAARIVLREGTKIEMAADSENSFAGTLLVTRDSSYHIELVSVDGETYNGSNEFDIVLLADQPPTVSFEKPGRDTRATSVEEIFTQAKAEDDYGVVSLDLYFSVNGAEDRKVDLQRLKSDAAHAMTGAHTFFLEEFQLQPGDFISYYAKARDAHAEATSDIYFIEVKPFEREFRQSQQPGGKAGGGQQEENALSKRQKELIAATFRIQREEATYAEAQKNENYNTVSLGQEKLRDDTNTLIERIKRRLGEQLDDQADFVKLVGNLEQAAKEMDAALVELKNHRSKEAMPAEHRALQQLLRADAIFREIQVAFGQSSGQGAASQRAEELADLFELELDKMKNQYETLKREQQQQGAQADDETKRKLEELARRQQRELEQQQQARNQGQPANSGGGGGGRQQQQLIDETRKAARELERLSRERRDPRMEELSRQLDQAANDMQRAQASKQNNNQTEAVAQNLRALQKLEEAQRQLQRSQQNQKGQSVRVFRQRAANAAAQQRKISDQVEDLAKRGQSSDPKRQEEKERLGSRKDELANEVGNLEKDLDQAARGFGQEQQRTGDQLRDAANSLRRDRVADRIRSTKQMVQNDSLDAARAGDRMVQQNLDETAQLLQEAEKNAARRGPGQETEDALDRTRQLADNLESLRRRIAEAGQGEKGQKGQQGQQGQQAQQGQQPGQQDGQQQGQRPGQQKSQQASQQGQQKGSQQGGQQQGKQAGQQQGGQQQGGQQQGKQAGQQQGGQQQGGQQQGKQAGQQQGGQQQGGQQQGGQQQGGQQQGGQQPGAGQADQGGQRSPGQGGDSRSQTPRNLQPGQFMPGGGPPAGGERQVGAELKERLREAEELKRSVGRERDLAKQLDQAIQGLRDLSDALYHEDTRTAALLKSQVIDPLRELEIQLSRRLQAKLGRNNLRLADQGEAPERYRKLVDEYYKRLSNRTTTP